MNTASSKLAGGMTLLLLFILLPLCKAQTTLVGTLDTKAGVSPIGGASYNIEIDLPKGVGGFRPSLSLAYNSMSGNGIAGYGFNISGLSSIMRGVKTKYRDGAASGMTYEDDDAYYLDGKRLILKEGTAGEDAAVYAPEGDPFTEVTLTKNSDGLITFTAIASDGNTFYYNAKQSEYVNSKICTMLWQVSKMTTPQGNTIVYYYYSDSRLSYISSINYDGNTVNFEYETRPDVQLFRWGPQSTEVKQRYRLKGITAKTGNSVFREYELKYDTLSDQTAAKYSRLSTVLVKGTDGSVFKPVRLAWNALPAFSPSCTSYNANLVSSDFEHEFTSRNFIAGDLNGDGISDIVQISPTKIQQNSHYTNKTVAFISLSKVTDGTVSHSSAYPLICYFNGIYSDDNWQSHTGAPTIRDIDGDGINDLFIPYTQESFGNPSGFNLQIVFGDKVDQKNRYIWPLYYTITQNPCVYDACDFDNDGKCDFVIIEQNDTAGKYKCHIVGNAIRVNNGAFIENHLTKLTLDGAPQRVIAADFDNNGAADIMVLYNTGYKIYWNNGGVLSADTFTESNSISGTELNATDILELGDFYGDGLPDLLQITTSGMIYLERYSGISKRFFRTTASSLQLPGITAENSRINVLDLDRDGKSDVVLNYKQGTTYWFRSTGSSLELLKQVTTKKEDDAGSMHYFVGDFRGEGYADLANYGYDCYNGGTSGTEQLRIYHTDLHNPSNGKLATATNGMDVTETFSYTSLTDDRIYEKGKKCTYPEADITIPLAVVSAHTTNDGQRQSTTSYHYKELRTAMTGRGLMGFGSITTANSLTGTTSETCVTLWDLGCHVARDTRVTTTTGGLTSTVAVETSRSNVNGNYIIYPSKRTETDIYNNQTVTTYTYNTTYGYLTKECKEYAGDNSYQETSYADYVYKGNAYHPQTIVRNQKHTDDASVFSLTTKLSYNDRGLPAQTIENYGTSKAVTTEYTYDLFGNKATETVSADGLTPATTTYYYNVWGKDMVMKKTTPISTMTTYAYDDYGNLTDVKDVLGVTKTVHHYTYDGFGRQLTDQHLAEPVRQTVMGWGAGGQQKYFVKTIQQGHPTVMTWYDSSGQPTRTESTGLKGVSTISQKQYDSLGRLSSETTTTGNRAVTQTYTYDGLNRMLSAASSSGKSVTYNYGNRLVTTTENGRSYTKTYDAWGNVKTSTDPLSSVSYTYNSNGKPASVTSGGATVSMTYDAVGDQQSLSDPDAGTTAYTYDPLGQLTSQTDARGKTTDYTYDALGRLTKKVADGISTTYTYGTAGNEYNLLVKEQTGDRSIAYTHDQWGRVIQEKRSMGGEADVTFQYAYDNASQLSQVTYPNGFSVQYIYDDNGNKTECKTGTSVVWRIKDYDGRTTTTQIGDTLSLAPVGPLYPLGDSSAGTNSVNGLGIGDKPGHEFSVAYRDVIHVSERDNRGFLVRQAMESGKTTIYENTYEYADGTGNLLSRTILGNKECFDYDNLDRLKTVSNGNGTVQQAITYNTNGNISSKTGLGAYQYGTGSVRPHAVQSVDNSSGILSLATQTATYTAFGKVATLSDGDYAMSFTYGPDEERWKTVLTQNGETVRTTIYAGNYERVTENGVTHHYCYIDGGAVYIKKDGANKGTVYHAFMDHLGSILTLMPANGSASFEATYDAWGCQTVTKNTLGFHRGYTGHEMLPEFGLINMNGRLYDPALGRFLSPDNYVQLPDFSQSFNRYSYCLNNPLKYTDPSGELFGIDDMIIANVVFSAAMGAMTAKMAEENVWAGALKGFASSALSAVGSYGIGQFFGHSLGSFGTEVLRAGAHGFNAGITNLVNGNNFFSGFLTGAVASGAGSGGQALSFGNGGIVGLTTLAGALTSQLIDGDWVCGALTGFNIGMFNHTWNDDDNKLIRIGENYYEAQTPLPEVIVYAGRKFEFNIDSAVSYLNRHAYPAYSVLTCGKCAKAVREAIQYGGINTSNHPYHAKQYGPYLHNWGFREISYTSEYSPIKGDIRVFQNYPTGSKSGHIDMYNGKQWVSDFKEKNFWPGSGYQKYQPSFTIYRW